MLSIPAVNRSSRNSGAAFILALVFALGLFFQAGPAKADAAAEAFIKNVGNSLISTMKSGGSTAQKRARFDRLFRSNADVPAIATFALGKYARQLPSGKRSEYFGLVRRYVSGIFAQRLSDFEGNAIVVSGSQDRGSKEVIVSSELRFSSNRAPLPLKWRVVKRSSGYKIFDVNVGGIWLAPEQRSVFVSIISKNGGDVNALLSHLRSTT